MRPSPIYRSHRLYEAAMAVLYGRHYRSRIRAVAELIPAGASVLELCSGPGALYRRHLRSKGIHYTAFDINPVFVEALRRSGAQADVRDVQVDSPLPPADYVVMQASLYQFLPDPSPMLGRMLAAAREGVIVAEPIRNLADSRRPLVRALARLMTRTERGEQNQRFTGRTLDELLESQPARVERSFLTAGGREKVVVLSDG